MKKLAYDRLIVRGASIDCNENIFILFGDGLLIFLSKWLLINAQCNFRAPSGFDFLRITAIGRAMYIAYLAKDGKKIPGLVNLLILTLQRVD